MKKMEMVIEATSVVGRVRENNEDMILAGHETLRNDTLRKSASVEGKERYIIALADGMGGHNGGEVASEMMLRDLDTFFYDIPDDLDEDGLIDRFFTWMASVNRSINGKGSEHFNLKGMGTTLVAFLAYNEKCYWVNCGDSRLYRIRRGKMEQMTRDHSLDMLTGLRSDSNVLLNCIGGCCPDSYVDLVNIPDVEIDDIYLLCSDGLTDMMLDSEIVDLINKGGTADDLARAANELGGYDNISACLVTITEKTE